MSMRPRSELNDRLVGPAGWRTSGNKWLGFYRRRPTCLRWRSYDGCGKPAIREARRRCTRWSPPFVRSRPSRWFVLKDSRERFSQHDFGQVDVEFLNGARQRIHFFASRLKYSRYVRVSLVQDETVESLVRTLAEHLASWGGRPLLCVFDRPKTIALAWRKNGEVTEWNSVFAYATLEMGVGVELCWPYRAQQKGSVENLVGFIKSSFFKVRRFHDGEDLEQQRREWEREVNEQRPCRATGIIPAVRLAEEAPRLRALKVQPHELALRIPVYVGRRFAAVVAVKGSLTPRQKTAHP